MDIYIQQMKREKSEDSRMWLVYIPLENAYFKIAGARDRESGTVFEKYSKNGPRQKDHETSDPEDFKNWFMEKFKVDPLGDNLTILPYEITLARHSKDTKRILDNLKLMSGKDYSIASDAVLRHYGLLR